jgi:hypothetical protein
MIRKLIFFQTNYLNELAIKNKSHIENNKQYIQCAVRSGYL